MDYCCAMERQDLHKIDKLNRLKDTRTFWNDVRKLTKTVRSDHSIGRWQILAEVRYGELCDIENCMSISRVLEENGICASVDSCGGFFVTVEILWGDWKHDHARAKWLVSEQGYMHISEKVTAEDGSDCYSAIHTFKKR